MSEIWENLLNLRKYSVPWHHTARPTQSSLRLLSWKCLKLPPWPQGRGVGGEIPGCQSPSASSFQTTNHWVFSFLFEPKMSQILLKNICNVVKHPGTIPESHRSRPVSNGAWRLNSQDLTQMPFVKNLLIGKRMSLSAHEAFLAFSRISSKSFARVCSVQSDLNHTVQLVLVDSCSVYRQEC